MVGQYVSVNNSHSFFLGADSALSQGISQYRGCHGYSSLYPAAEPDNRTQNVVLIVVISPLFLYHGAPG